MQNLKKTKLIDTTEIENYYTFHHVDKETAEEVYFCNCGKKITEKDNKNENPDEVTVTLEDNKYYSDMDIYDKIEGASVICPKCEADYSIAKNFQRVKPSNTNFYGAFKFENTEKRITLHRAKIKATCTLNSKKVSFKEDIDYISVDKENKKLFIKVSTKKEEEFSLDSIVKIINSFFKIEDLSVMDNLIDVHRFLSALASIVSDAKNMDIVDGLMSQMLGRPGMDVMKKIVTIFFGIICYSNLSTIALTKGTVFLYDMMSNCHLPNVQTLSDNGVTSPLNIFNFLVTIENEEVQKEIESEINNGDFVYESKDGKKINMNLELERFGFKRSSNIDISSGGIHVREDLKHKTVSKYIFNNIEKFEDYRKLIRYTKFITYEELIVLVMKYDIKFLVNIFEIIEFRIDINMNSLGQIMPLVLDFLKDRNIQSNSHYDFNSRLKLIAGIDDEQQEVEEVEIEEKEGEELPLNYDLVNLFSFHEYDDSVRMIEELEWDREKEFNKIKKIREIKEYHNKLVEHYNMLTDKEKYDKFNKFANKFKYLEKYKDTLKLKVLSSPTMVLGAAKDMKNCAGSYVTRISQGKYLLMLMWDKSKKRKPSEENYFMVGFNVTHTGLEFDQLKATCNKPASNRQKKLVMTYLRKKDISYREVRDLRIIDDKSKDSLLNAFDDFDNYNEFIR